MMGAAIMPTPYARPLREAAHPGCRRPRPSDADGATAPLRTGAPSPARGRGRESNVKRFLVAATALLLMGSMALAQTTITVAAGAVGQELELARAAAERYMAENPGVTVEVLETPDLADSRLGVYLQIFEAQSPDVDVFQIDVIWPGDLAEHLVDLNEYGAAEVVDQHFPAIVQNNTVDGRLVGLPWFTHAGLLYHPTDLLAMHGFDAPPGTWDDPTQMAQAIQDG